MESVKKFKLDPSRGVKQNVELIPPPSLTDHPLPFNWGYHQNSAIRIKTDEKTGEKILVNQSAPEKVNTLYISHNVKTVPQAAPKAPPQEPVLRSLVAELLKALDERPIWTRRAILNHIGSVPGLYLLKPAIQYVGYQFRGGPWRDAVIKYGIDPRTDPKYRFYQTLFFKIFDETEKVPGQPWHDIRSEYTRKAHQDASSRVSHIFDGKTISLDGKIWQICDVNDPLVKRIVATDAVRVTCDIDSDGWWCNGTFAKIKAVMRAKISAIRIGRELTEEEFEPTLAFPDVIKDKKKPSAPMPDWRHDLADLEGSGMATALKMGSIRKRRVKGKAHRSTKGGTTGIPIWRKQSKKSGMKATSVSTTDPSFDGVMGVLGENGTPERPDETRNKSTHGIFGLDEDDDDEREIYDLVIEDEEGMESDSVDDPFETADEGEYGDYTMMEDEV